MWQLKQPSRQKKHLLYGDSDCQVFTPFCSSALNYQTAIFSCHSYQKTMSTLAGDITWLIRSFHLDLPQQNYFSGNGLLNIPPPLCQVLYYPILNTLPIDLP
jgi:hypothetical protein